MLLFSSALLQIDSQSYLGLISACSFVSSPFSFGRNLSLIRVAVFRSFTSSKEELTGHFDLVFPFPFCSSSSLLFPLCFPFVLPFVVPFASRNLSRLRGGGVVHSFTGTMLELESYLDLPGHFFVGVNGCSLKTQENLDGKEGRGSEGGMDVPRSQEVSL